MKALVLAKFVTALFFIFVFATSCGPPPQVACSGPAPITCECVTSCTADDAGVTTDPPLYGAALQTGCVGRCWDRSKAGAP